MYQAVIHSQIGCDHSQYGNETTAKGTERAGSDIDLMVIADDIDYAELFTALPDVEASLARTVNPNLMTCSEWQRKRDEPDSVAARVASQPMLFVTGDAKVLAESR